jgi:hypothetical protein
MEKLWDEICVGCDMQLDYQSFRAYDDERVVLD